MEAFGVLALIVGGGLAVPLSVWIMGVWENASMKRRQRAVAYTPNPFRERLGYKRQLRHAAFKEWQENYDRLLWEHFDSYIPTQAEIDSGLYEIMEIKSFNGHVVEYTCIRTDGKEPPLVPKIGRGLREGRGGGAYLS